MIDFNGIDLNFGEQQVLAGFSASIGEGEKVLFYGESGTGKSSLLRMILGFTTPSRGSVTYRGDEIDPHTAWTIRREAGFVPQESDLGEGTGEELIESVFGFRHNAKSRPDESVVTDWLRFLKLDRSLLAKPMSDLSGGERQRVGVLTALLLDRNLFLLDEATASLDDAMKRAVVELFAQRSEWTVVAVSHDVVWRENPRFRVIEMQDKRSGT